MSKFNTNIRKENTIRLQSGGFNMDFLKNIAGNWKNYMKDPFSQESENYINDLVGRNKSSLTSRTDLQKQLILPGQEYNQWGDAADAAYTQKIWDDNYSSKYGKKWSELDASVQEGIWKDHKYKRPGLFNDDKLGGDLHQSGAMFDKDKATRSQLGNVNKTFNNQLLETGAGIFSLMNAQKEYDNKPQEKFALDFTDDKGILRSQTGGSIPTSPLGLYKYPGQVVNVPGNDITMKGINEPVLAYPNNDKPELMLPGQNYKFPNSTNVVEVPMSQQGGNTNNSFNMLNKKYGKKVMSYQAGAPVYQGASPRILPVAPILPMGMGVKPKDLEENVKPAYGKSLVDAYKDELKAKEEGFDYYKHYMTKGNNNEAFGAFIGRAIGNKREKNKLAKLQDQQDKLDDVAEQKASMQSALNKGLNAYRDKQGDQIAAQFRDKNGNLKEVAVGNTANPATRNFVEKLDENGTVPGTDVTPANTVASKANSSSGSNGSGAYSPYSLPGDKTYEYAKDSNGDWVTRKRGNKEGAYVTLLDNKAAMDKLNKQAVAGDLYAGYSSGSGNSGKSKSTSSSGSSGSSSKFKSPITNNSYNNVSGEVVDYLKSKGLEVNGENVDAVMNRKPVNIQKTIGTPSGLLNNRPVGIYNNTKNKGTSEYDNNLSIPGPRFGAPRGTWSEKEKKYERDALITGATLLPAGRVAGAAGKMIVTNIPKIGRVVEVGGQYVDDLGRYVSKNGNVLGKAPKEIAAKTKEFFKRGESIGVQEYGKQFSTKTKDIAYGLTRLPNGRISKLQDTRGGLQKMMENSNLSASFKNTLNSVATTGKRLYKKAYDALSKTEKSTYDSVIADKLAKFQAGGSTFSRENLFNHYYNNM